MLDTVTLQRVFDTITDSVILARHQSLEIVYANPAAAHLTGYARQDLARLTLPDLIAPALRDSLQDTWHECATGEPHCVQHVLLTRDGSLIHVGSTLSVEEVDGQLHLIWVARARDGAMSLQAALASPDDIHRRIFDSAPSGIFGFDSAERTFYFNPVYARMNGLDAGHGENLPGLATIDEHPVIRQNDLLDELRGVLHRTPFVRVIPHFSLQNSDTISVVAHGFPLFDSDGQVVGGLAVINSASRQAGTEDRLSISERRYGALIAAVPEEMLRLDNRSIVLDYKPPRQGLALAQSPEIGQPLAAVWPAELMDDTLAAITRVLNSGAAEILDYQAGPAGDGQELEIHAVASGADEVLLMVRNVTSQKRTLAALQASSKMSQALLDATSDAAILCDQEFTILATNEKGARLLNQPAEALIGRSILEFDDPNSSVRERIEAARQVVQTGMTMRFEESRLGMLLETVIVPVRGVDNRITQIAAFMHDMTAHRTVIEILREQEATLQDITQATIQLLANRDLETAIPSALETLGKATRVGRVYVYESHPHPTLPETAISLRYEWGSEPDAYLRTHPELKNIPWSDVGTPEQDDMLRQAQTIIGPANEVLFPGRKYLGKPGAKSLVVVPIFSGTCYWGMLGLINYVEEREWGSEEISVIRTMAASLGAAILRQKVEAKLRSEREFANTLRDVGTILNSTLERDDVLRRMLEQIRRVIPYDAANVMLVHGKVVQVTLNTGYEAFGLTEEQINQMHFETEQFPLLARIMHTREAAVFSDVAQVPEWRDIPATRWIGSWLAAPIVVRGEVIGLFSLDSAQRGFYDASHLPIIRAFSQQAALALHNATLYQQVQDQAAELTAKLEHLDAMYHSSQSIMATLDRDEALARLLEQVKRVIPYDAANVMLVEGNTAQIKVLTGYEAFETPVETFLNYQFHIPSVFTLKEMADTQQPFFVPDIQQEPRWKKLGLTDDWHGSWLGAPIVVRGEIVAFFGLDARTRGLYGPEHAQILATFAQQAAIAVQNAKLYQQVQQQAHELSVRLTQLDALYAAGQSILSTLRLDEVLTRLAVQMTHLTNATSTIICDYDPDDRTGIIQSIYRRADVPSRDDVRMIGERVHLESPLLQEVVRTRQSALLTRSEFLQAMQNNSCAQHVESAFVVPMLNKDRMVSLAIIRETRAGRIHTLGELWMCEALANQAAIALEQAILFEHIRELELVKSTIIRLASHDLRSPLTRIRGFAELLERQLNSTLTDTQREYFALIARASHDIECIANDILSLERIEAQLQQATPIHWHDLIHAAVQSFDVEIQHKALILVVECDDELPSVKGDPVQISQAISNLVGNAIKYTPVGGQITVRGFTAKQAGKPAVTIEVIDTGVGIHPDEQNRLFEPFFRARDQGDENIPGLGLGLSVVKAAVEYHRGKVYVDSEFGRGSRFGFWVPVA